jgi:hypothetical protein
MKLNFEKALGLINNIQRTWNKRGAIVASVVTRAADLGPLTSDDL